MNIFTRKRNALGIKGLLAAAVFVAGGLSVKAQSLQADSTALVNLYNNTSGSSWVNKTNWLSAAPLSSWYGVTITSGRVSAVSLPANGLSGALPDLVNQLSAVRELNLSDNALTGSLGYMGNANLQVLNLSKNQLSGSIPDWNNFNGLTTLNLSHNQFSGGLANQNMAVLQHLDVSYNQFSGNVPYPSTSSVKTLDCSHNQFTGGVHNFWQGVPNLTYYDASYNKLSGNLPWISWVEVTYLNVSNNNLSGSLNYYNFPSIQTLDFSNNKFSGDIPYFAGANYNALKINNNKYTFNQIESRAGAFPSASVYAPQDTILPIQFASGMLSVNAGGTTSKNTYKWYVGSTLAGTTVGNSSFSPTQSGNYHVEVTNSDATALTLSSDIISVITLPVNLVSFKARLEGNWAKLSWATASVYNFYGFEAERSTDGKSWTLVGTIKSQQAGNYSYFDDTEGLQGTIYYRLKQVDNDGSFTYSEVVSVKSEIAPALVAAVAVYPNPSLGGTVKVQFPETATLATLLKITDVTGKLLQSLTVPANTSQFQLNRSELQSGVYHIFWVNGNKKYRPATLLVQ